MSGRDLVRVGVTYVGGRGRDDGAASGVGLLQGQVVHELPVQGQVPALSLSARGVLYAHA